MKQEMMGLAVASAGPHANHLHLTSDVTMPAHHHSIFYYSRDALPDVQSTVSKH